MEIRFVTLNLKIDSKEGFERRLPLIIGRIAKELPHIICFQEMSDTMASVIMKELPEYVLIGGGRDSDRLGEGTPIAYRRDAFAVTEFRTRWLSNEPFTPSSTFGGDQSGCPRVYTFALLTDLESRLTFRVYNTHFDHVGAKARMMETEMMIREITADRALFPYPFIMCGDLNAMPHSPEIKLLSGTAGFTDITTDFKQTFNNFGREFDFNKESKIDYIFISDEIKSGECHLWDDKKDDIYLSDHYAISAVLELN